jgi:hypothetical protein
MVFVKIQPYVQSTLAACANQKLSFKFYGPFQIIAKIGSVAYKLHLPLSMSIHPVFHVSQLKAAITSGTQVSPSLPTDIELPRIPLEVLQHRSAPTAIGLWSKASLCGQAGLMTWQHGRICIIYAKPFRAPLLGDKQVYKTQGLLRAHLL